MDVDWIVGIFVFMFFVAWGFSYYFMIFEDSTTTLEAWAQSERAKVMDYISVDVYEAPVIYESPGAVSGAVLRADSVWYSGEKNATRVFSGSSRLPCIISGDSIYWQADVASGSNGFRLQTAGINSTMNCTGSFSTASSNLTIPWAFEKSAMVSLARIGSMASMGYDSFRGLIGMNEDFSMKIERGGNETVYGKSRPQGPVDVDSREFRRTVMETGEAVNITVAVW